MYLSTICCSKVFDNAFAFSMGVFRANSSKQVKFVQATTGTVYQGALRGFYVRRGDR